VIPAKNVHSPELVIAATVRRVLLLCSLAVARSAFRRLLATTSDSVRHSLSDADGSAVLSLVVVMEDMPLSPDGVEFSSSPRGNVETSR
jgi:hypothetical protein